MGAGFGEAEHSETETERDFAFRPGAAAETETRNRDSCPFWQVHRSSDCLNRSTIQGELGFGRPRSARSARTSPTLLLAAVAVSR